MARGVYRFGKVTPPVIPAKSVQFEDILRRLRDHGREVDESFLGEVHSFSREWHGEQLRKSGEPYFIHPCHVAYLLADRGFDQTCVAVGLLHDVLEDTLTTRESLVDRFGEEVAELVDGVTKIGQHAYVRRDHAQAETFRKLILASAKDIRVILVKLADRLHNMMTLEHLEAESRRRIARETLEIYAPIAQRLGMSKVQGELEDLAFYFLYPHQFEDLQIKLQKKLKLGEAATKRARERIEDSLGEAEIGAEISSRVKRYFSIFRKLKRVDNDLAQVYDYLAVRIVTESVRDCYAALGIVHQIWRPMPGRFKDYISLPKSNLYQSLHTTLVSEDGQPFEVQIRTREMDQIAEEGIAAHWHYKEKKEGFAEADQNILWLRQLLEWQKEVDDPQAFMSTLKIDLYPQEVYIFTPKGDVHSFPRGATPLDFAYRIHTDLGHRCVGARVNGKLVPLKTVLRNGDIVEIRTNPARNPSRDWLNFVVTSRAKSKIRQWVNTQQRTRAIEIGRGLFEKEVRKYRLSPKKILGSEELAGYMASEGVANADDFLGRIGFGKIGVRNVLNRILTTDQLATADEKPGRIRSAVSRMLPSGGSPIQVKGHEDMLSYLAKCCNPLPGEKIVGYITRGRGVSVHALVCPNVENLLYHPEREIEVEWAKPGEEVYPVVLEIETEDRQGMLARLTDTVSKQEGNIRQIEAETVEPGKGLIEMVVEVRNRKQLEKLCSALGTISGVLRVGRLRNSDAKSDGEDLSG